MLKSLINYPLCWCQKQAWFWARVSIRQAAPIKTLTISQPWALLIMIGRSLTNSASAEAAALPVRAATIHPHEVVAIDRHLTLPCGSRSQPLLWARVCHAAATPLS